MVSENNGWNTMDRPIKQRRCLKRDESTKRTGHSHQEKIARNLRSQDNKEEKTYMSCQQKVGGKDRQGKKIRDDAKQPGLLIYFHFWVFPILLNIYICMPRLSRVQPKYRFYYCCVLIYKGLIYLPICIHYKPELDIGLSRSVLLLHVLIGASMPHCLSLLPYAIQSPCLCTVLQSQASLSVIELCHFSAVLLYSPVDLCLFSVLQMCLFQAANIGIQCRYRQRSQACRQPMRQADNQ